MRTDSTSMPAPVPMIAGTENRAKPNQIINRTAAPRLGRTAGIVTLRIVRNSDAPDTRDCSSRAGSTLRSPADTSRKA